MNSRRISTNSLQQFVQQVFNRIGYPADQAADAANVLLWASLRGVDTHGIRNLKSYYVDRTLDGQLNPAAQIHIERETELTACLNGDSGLGLSCACRAMRLAVDKARAAGVGIVSVRNTHHLGPAGYFAHLAVEQGMLGICMTGHFFGRGHTIGIAPLESLLPMFSTNPLSFATPCGRHAPFVLDMSTSVATVNRIEMHTQQGRPVPAGWARDAQGVSTTDPSAAHALLPLGATAELGGYKGAGLAMMVSILSGVLSGAWARVTSEIAEETATPPQPAHYDQATMGHFFAAIQIDLFQPLEQFRNAMDAMIDALHSAPTIGPNQKVHYAGEIEAATADERSRHGIPVGDRIFNELQALAAQLGLEVPHS